ncbi:hypothetical protein BO70DRAFT_78001 [Aspergillus heteromorphus CBS 117.55]|uniref:Uncharacterized protein n=1 Tax=Aspergillus heteromorphus CBS 117.55 TaxID=1448321 RepID=A0A317WWR5_9EURO|nr:uncharacterized protein BO70DRAFT_78001 [Aspergillus heteromorphus CBS 117.55]PWY90773.1 hypothetical protein BO70DRAFT_78001 [Aspergillus heteromorphus CBS 117.55]
MVSDSNFTFSSNPPNSLLYTGKATTWQQFNFLPILPSSAAVAFLICTVLDRPAKPPDTLGLGLHCPPKPNGIPTAAKVRMGPLYRPLSGVQGPLHVNTWIISGLGVTQERRELRKAGRAPDNSASKPNAPSSCRGCIEPFSTAAVESES